MRTPTIQIVGLSAEAVKVIVRETIESFYRLREEAQEAVNKQVRETVEELTIETSKEQIAALVAKVLDDGFEEHDRYGNKQGKRVTAQALIIEQLTAKVGGDSYGRDTQTWAQKAAGTVLGHTLETHFKADLERAKVAFKSQIDELLKGKLVESMKSALGLR
jgi:frataxin-like iron-binding protein CyaY